MAMTNAQKQAARRERLKAQGLKQVQVYLCDVDIEQAAAAFPSESKDIAYTNIFRAGVKSIARGVAAVNDDLEIEQVRRENARLRSELAARIKELEAAAVRDPNTNDWIESDKDKRIHELEAQLSAVRSLANEAASAIASPSSPRQANLWAFLGKLKQLLVTNG
jgi:hypothetical protein